jgi:hypothetical protein
MSIVRRGSMLLALWGLGCSGGSGLPDAGPPDAPADAGRFSISWTIADGTRTLRCDDVGALLVTVEVTGPDIAGGVVEAFSCAAGTGTSRILAPGVYNLSFELIGRGGLSLGELSSQQIVVPGAGVVPAQPLAFPVSASGLIDARLVAGADMNCTAIGANLSAMTVVLERQGGACVPTTFQISAGAAQPASTYVSTCGPTPAVSPCIERDQAVTASVNSGAYVVRVRGLIGAATCWFADLLADVPPQRRTLRIDVALASLKGTPGCP